MAASKTPANKPEPQQADKDAIPGPPDEARMSELAKRLLSTPPDRQSVGRAVAPKQSKRD